MVHNNSMAPEIFTGSNANNTVDVYSFGCIILEILTNDYARFDQSNIVADNIGMFVANGLRPIIPDNLPESINKSIDINHRV